MRGKKKDLHAKRGNTKCLLMQLAIAREHMGVYAKEVTRNSAGIAVSFEDDASSQEWVELQFRHQQCCRDGRLDALVA